MHELTALRELIGDVGGGTTPGRGEELYEWVRRQRPVDCLELGFAHGVSTVYIAGALESAGDGRLTSIDREMVRDLEPSAVDMVERASLSHRVELVYEVSSYNWFLHRRLREQTRDGHCEPCYDFVFLDGAHTWEDDGLAFLLVDKLLRPGGWILFDDLDWRLDERWADVPAEQRALFQVREIFDLLVATHPGYRELRADGNWGWARKAVETDPPIRTVRERDVYGTFRDIVRIVRRRGAGG
jgi:predicted O-methyltransferase YrrM